MGYFFAAALLLFLFLLVALLLRRPVGSEGVASQPDKGATRLEPASEEPRVPPGPGGRQPPP